VKIMMDRENHVICCFVCEIETINTF